jgi:2-C-methyl-D-erythritol 4-phosphate cytidylyltransferase
MTSENKIWAVVPAGGRGARMGSELPKQYLQLAGKTILEHTLDRLLGEPRIAGVVVAMAAGDDIGQALVAAHAPRVRAAAGGVERCHSVLNGIEALAAADDDWVLVHDAARCLITPSQIDTLIDACLSDPVGGLLAHRLADTLKAEQDGRVAATVARADKWLAQTPQMFRIGPLRQALQAAGEQVTDESSAMEAMGWQPRLVPGSARNFKVTYPEDFALAEALLLSDTHKKANS